MGMETAYVWLYFEDLSLGLRNLADLWKLDEEECSIVAMCQFEYLHVQTSCMYIDGASKLAVAKARGQRSYVLYHVIYIQGGYPEDKY